MTTQRASEAIAQRRGLITILVLAVLTAVEYAVAVGIDATAVLVALLSATAVTKAALIVEYFMHCSKLWHGEGAE